MKYINDFEEWMEALEEQAEKGDPFDCNQAADIFDVMCEKHELLTKIFKEARNTEDAKSFVKWLWKLEEKINS